MARGLPNRLHRYGTPSNRPLKAISHSLRRPTLGAVLVRRSLLIMVCHRIIQLFSTNLPGGSSHVRAGWSFDTVPRISFPADVARFRDRKYNRTVSYVGYNAYADATTRGQIRNAFEPGTSIVGNWDVMEGVLDNIFLNLGIEGENGGVGRPILMTEPVANFGYSRKSTWQRLRSVVQKIVDLCSYE